MLLPAVLLLLSPGLGEARRRKELPIDREPGEAGTQQRAKASGEQSRCKREKGSGFNLLSAAIGVLQSEAVFWVEWPSSVGQAGPGRAYHGLTCRALHSSCPPCSVQPRNSLSLSTIRPRVVTACASPSLSPSLSLHDTRRRKQQRPVCGLVNPRVIQSG